MRRPASFSDHFTQPRLFWLSMTPPEREHIIAAYTFELGKCYEQAIKERTLKVLANIDPDLCEQVTTGLGLPAPAATVPLVAADPSPALSQRGGTWPTDGRVIGIVADTAADLDGVRTARQAVLDAGMVPLGVAPTGGTLDSKGDPIAVQRTFAAARSVEFDAVLLAGVPQAGADAYGARDARPALPGLPKPPTPAYCCSSPRRTGTARPWAAGTARSGSSNPPASRQCRTRSRAGAGFPRQAGEASAFGVGKVACTRHPARRAVSPPPHRVHGVRASAAPSDGTIEGGPVDGIVLLKEDHKTVEKLFKQFEKAGDNAHATKRKIADQVIEELTTHTWIEEKIFYPAAREAAPDTKDHVLESIEEHHVVLWMLSELKGLDASDERFDAKMTVLMESVRHHVEEEEKEWFPEVRKAMGRNRLTELGARMETAKKTAPADPLAVPSA